MWRRSVTQVGSFVTLHVVARAEIIACCREGVSSGRASKGSRNSPVERVSIDRIKQLKRSWLDAEATATGTNVVKAGIMWDRGIGQHSACAWQIPEIGWKLRFYAVLGALFGRWVPWRKGAAARNPSSGRCGDARVAEGACRSLVKVA